MVSTLVNFLLRAKNADAPLFKKLVDKYTPKFKCICCDSIPDDIAYVLSNCSHYLCRNCKLRGIPDQCLKCECAIDCEPVPDPIFLMFYECYKQRHLPESSDGKMPVDAVKQFKGKIDFLLQDECRKVFKKTGGHLDYVKLLLILGANPNVLNRDGWTLLHEAVDYDDVDVLETLLLGGGLVNAYKLDSCSTCLHDALDEEEVNERLVQTLLKYGANIELRDAMGHTPLYKALRNENIHRLLMAESNIQDRINVPVKVKPCGAPVIFGSDLSSRNQKKLNFFCRRFKIKISKYKMSNEVTHVVVETDNCRASSPVLTGILQGCLIITMKWVQDCINANSLIDPESYEITGTEEFPLRHAARTSRINSLYLKPRLFAGGQFKILDSMEERFSQADKEMLADLITTGGGKLLVRSKSCEDSIGQSFLYHAYGGPFQYCTIIVIHKNDPKANDWDTIGHVSMQWICKSIQTFSILP